jgi:RNA polymerase sigma factor (sigma-70 family)
MCGVDRPNNEKEPDKTARFESLMLPHLDAAYNLARWLTRRADQADEAVQEAYLRAFRYFDSFTGADGRVWLLAIVRNCCMNAYRREKGNEVLFDERSHLPEASGATPETALLKKTATHALRDCIETLPPEYRETLIMRELEEFSYKQISDTIALPIGTVMSRLSRARKRLQDCMRAKGEN